MRRSLWFRSDGRRAFPRGLALAPVLVFVISACSGGAAATVSPSVAPSASSPATAAPPTASPTPDLAAAFAEIEAAAKAEGGATIYTTEVPAWIDATTAAFKEATDLEMILGVRGGSGTIEERLTGEIQAGVIGTDLFSVIDRDYFTANKDWFMNLAEAGLPNWATYPEEAKWQDICAITKTSVTGLLYNNELVAAADAPDQWEDLIDPRWKGKFMLIDPRASNSPMGWAIQMQKAYGMEYLEAIAAQEPDLSESTAPAAEQVGAGAYEITVTSQADSSSALRASGAPLTFVVPSEGPTLGNAACVGILKDSKAPNAAKVLLNYLMSPESQSIACKAGVEVQSPIAADGCYQVPAGWKATPVDPTTGKIEGTEDQALKDSILKALGIT